jgi:hypothetical protein
VGHDQLLWDDPGKEGGTGKTDRTCELMDDLAGTICPAAISSQSVDGVNSVKDISHIER